VVYSNSLSYPLSSLDDLSALAENPDLGRVGDTPLRTRWLVDLSFRLNYLVSGLNVADYRMTNLLIHIVAALCLMGILRRTFALPGMPSFMRSGSGNIAGLSALLWAVHPLQTASLTYVCQRYESMMGMFFLLALYLFIRSLSSVRPRAWFNLCLLASVSGMATKDVIVVLPAMLLAYDWTFGSEFGCAGVSTRRVRHAALFLVLGVFAMLWVLGVVYGSSLGYVPLAPVSPWDYLKTQFGVVLHYFRLSVVPHPLCFDYGWPVETRAWVSAVTGSVIVLLLAWSVWLLVHRRPAGFAAAWIFGILAPTSSVFPLPDAAFEHRMYLPLAGILVLLVAGVARVTDALTGRTSASAGFMRVVKVALASACVLAASAMTVDRNRAYSSAETMWRDVLRKRPGNWRAYINLAAALSEKGDYDGAIRLCADLLDRLPRKVTQAGPNAVPSEAYESRNVYFYARAHELLGAALDRRCDSSNALLHYEETLMADPRNAWARLNMASLLVRNGRQAEALDEFARVAGENPNWAEAWFRRGQALAGAGRVSEAAYCLESALQADSAHLGAMASLAWMRAAAPDDSIRNGRQALELAGKLVEASGGGSMRALQILAGAQAENGDYDAAVASLTQAVRLLELNAETVASGYDRWRAEMVRMMESYRRKNPYRDTALEDRPTRGAGRE